MIFILVACSFLLLIGCESLMEFESTILHPVVSDLAVSDLEDRDQSERYGCAIRIGAENAVIAPTGDHSSDNPFAIVCGHQFFNIDLEITDLGSKFL